jgi:predicted NUDIX family phosphoesterase
MGGIADYGELAERGAALKELLANQARRPYVLEVTGTPKAGKTSTIQMVEAFFKSCGWRVHVLRERASECPIPMKGHFFFNTWTTATMLAQVLDVVDRPIDLVILDRGFFDALIWLELQRSRGQVTKGEARAFTNFVLLDRWRELVDLTVVMSVGPRTAMKREQIGKLIPRRGSIMNRVVLAEFNTALKAARRAHKQRFRLLERSSEGSDQKKVVASLVQDLLDRVERWVDPQIAAVPDHVVHEIFSGRHAVPWSTRIWGSVASSTRYVKRSMAEENERVVQVVACGIPVRRNGVFVFDRTRDTKRLGEYGPHSLWSGQHVERQSKSRQPVDLKNVRANLVRRLRWNLHLNFHFDPRPLGIVWLDDPKRPRSKQHMGIFFAVRIEDEDVAQSLEDKEFRTSGRGHPATSQFSTLAELRNGKLEFEPWSQQVVDSGWLNERR